jgi:hypothetical protein
MSSSLTVFEHEHKAREKYIYFICGVAGALVAYIGKDYKPNNPWTIYDTLTMWTLACLTLSFVLGLGRILTYIQGMSINRDVLVKEGELASLNSSRAFHLEHQGKGIPVTVSSKRQTPLSTAEIEIAIDKLNSMKAEYSIRMKRWHKWSTFFLVVCQIFLVAGFILLLCSKFIF